MQPMMTSHFSHMDTPQALYDELKDLQMKIEQAGLDVKATARDAANFRATYEDKKNKFLIAAFADESKEGAKKRTEQHRTALYRDMYSTERLQWQLAENEYKASVDYLKALLAMLTATQTKVRLVEHEWKN